MLTQDSPRAFDVPETTPDPEPPQLEAPDYLVERYLELTAQRKQIEDQLAYVRAELELLAAPALKDGVTRARFASGAGAIHVRAMPTCVFDRAEVARLLQKEGRLADVAVLQGPALARYLASDQHLAARLGPVIRYRNSVVLTTTAI